MHVNGTPWTNLQAYQVFNLTLRTHSVFTFYLCFTDLLQRMAQCQGFGQDQNEYAIDLWHNSTQ